MIEGGATNKCFILDLLDQPEVVDGTAAGPTPAGSTGPAARAGCTCTGTPGSRWSRPRIDAYEDEERLEIAPRCSRPPAAAGPSVQHEVGRAVDLKLRGHVVQGHRRCSIGPHRFRVGSASGDDRRSSTSSVDRLDALHSRLDRRRPALPAGRPRRTARSHLVEVDGVTHRVTPRRGRRAALAGAGARRGVPGRRRRPGRGRRNGARPREHEDGDGGAGAVRRPGARGPGARPAARSRPARRCCARAGGGEAEEASQADAEAGAASSCRDATRPGRRREQRVARGWPRCAR